MQNPFTLSFGKKPLQYISRISQTNQIVETFRSDNRGKEIGHNGYDDQYSIRDKEG